MNGPVHTRRQSASTDRAIGPKSPDRQARSRDAITGGHHATPVRRALNEREVIDFANTPASVQGVVRSAGEPLEPRMRSSFEVPFGQDFSRVRLHSDESAALAAAEVKAKAFTVGHHIAFGRGQHAPTTPKGADLIAHELAHVVQQSQMAQGERPRLQREPEDDDSEARNATRQGKGGDAAAKTGTCNRG